MQFEVFTLLPEVVPPYLDTSILNRARQKGLIDVRVHNIRDYTHDKHHTTDDTSYGGGGGMVMKPEPVFEAVESVLGLETLHSQPVAVPVILLTPQGRVTDEISIGDYVLTGGELPALMIIDAVSRLIPGVLGDPTGAEDDSHSMGLLEYPHYTKPPEFRGWKVPDVLASGNHARINEWRREQALARTFYKRPDMLEKAELSEKDKNFVEGLRSKVEGPEVDV
jgi:tRNA (guanine37-N1)-methyltransferase